MATLIVGLLKRVIGAFVFKKIKEKIAAKALASTKSATMYSVAGLLAAAVWVQTHPDVVASVIGAGWGGVAVAVAGVIVAVARMRSL